MEFERKKPKFSIIIPSWFTGNQSGKYGPLETFWFATHCLKRLIDVTPKDSYELIIIDNGSTIWDSTLQLVFNAEYCKEHGIESAIDVRYPA